MDHKIELDVELPLELADRLEEIARQKHCSVEDLIIHYVTWYVRTYPKKAVFPKERLKGSV